VEAKMGQYDQMQQQVQDCQGLVAQGKEMWDEREKLMEFIQELKQRGMLRPGAEAGQWDPVENVDEANKLRA
jgi:cell division protein FtsB